MSEVKSRRWFNPLTWGRAKEPEAKTFEMLIQVGEDGFIPAISFSGGNLETLLTQAVWSWVAMSTIAKDVASLPGVVQVRDRQSGEWTNDLAHPLNAVIRRPFGKGPDLPPWGWGQLIETMSFHLDLCGNAYLRKITSGMGGQERLTALQLIKPTDVDVSEYPNGAAMTYNVGGAGGRGLPPEDIVNVMNASPGSYWKGIATITAAQNAIVVDTQAAKRLKYDLTNRLSPGAVIKVRNHFGIHEEQRDTINEYLTGQFGKAEQTGKPLIVGDQTEIESFPMSQVSDLNDHRKHARDEVLAIWNVPPPIAGVMDAATLQNAEVSLRLYWMQALRPRIGRIIGAINTQAVEPIYGPDVRVGYELSDNELGLTILSSRAAVAKTLHRDLDYATNESAARVGLNMPKHDDLENNRSTQATVAGREDVNSGATEGRSS